MTLENLRNLEKIGQLKGLYEGNIARFRLRPAEFAAWQGSESHVR